MKIARLPPVPGTVAAYLRVSSRLQQQRETIASQREAVLEHAGSRGWIIPEDQVFAADGVSGATLDRPALEALRDAVASGRVETVLVWSVDRLSRNFAHQMLLQEEFDRSGVKIVFAQEPDDGTPQGMLLRQMLSVISEYERTQIAERSRRGKIHLARQGSLNMITRAPYGYRLIRKTETSGARLEIDDAEATVVRRIYDLYVRKGLAMNALARRLDAEGWRPRHAELWPISTVAVILRNEAYVGRAAYLKTTGTGRRARPNRTGRRQLGVVRRWTGRTARPRREWIELPVPAILDETIFARAQQRRADNRRFSPRRTKEVTLLQGLCVCAHCGYGMGRNSGSGGRGGRRLHYYRCYGTEHWRYAQGAVCDNPAVRAEDIDDAVWQEMLTLLQHPELIQAEIERRLVAANDTASPRRRIESLQGELSRIQTRFRRLLDAYQEGIVTLDELRRRNAPLQTRQCSIQSELEALQTSELDRESQLALATTIQQFLQRMRQAAQSLSILERQRIVRLLVREVRIGKDSVTICHSIPLNDLPPTGSDPSPGQLSNTKRASGRSGLLIPRYRHVVQHESVLVQMAPGQGVLDGLLAGTQQPVHGPVDLVFIDGSETQSLREGGEGDLAGERPGSGQLGLGVDDSGDDQSDDQIPVPAPGAGQQSIQLEFLEGGQDGGDVTMGERVGAVEDVFGVDEGLALESSADEIDDGIGEMGDVAEGFMFDPAVLAEGATKEMGAVDLVFVPASGGGYVNGATSYRNAIYYPEYGGLGQVC